jgi:hypothetical protein
MSVSVVFSDPVPYFDGVPFHFDNSSPWLNTRYTRDRLTAAMSVFLAEPSQLGPSDLGMRFVFNKGTTEVSTTF